MENVKYDDICTSLECCRHNECSKCFYKGSSDCILELMEDAGRTIKKLQALTDRLRIANTNSYGSGYSIGYIKGVKEFAEKVKPIFEEMFNLMMDDDEGNCIIENCKKHSSVPCMNEYCIKENKEAWLTKIDKLVKEMVGDDNA